jgi:glycosyltransferase involved in cell wall biosynthesis
VWPRRRRRNGYDRLGLLILTHTTDYLDECLASVANQTVAPSAIVLVDNGSGTDAVRDLARPYGIPTIRLDSAVSPSAARNIGCSALADCDLIVSLDGDDLIQPRFVEVYWSTARQHQADVVFGAAELIGSQTGLAFTRDELTLAPDLRRSNYIPANALFKRSLWREVGGFDPSVVYYEDWDFWLSLAERGALIEQIDEPLWCYRRHERSRMASSDTDEVMRSKQIIRQKHRRHIFGVLQWRRVLWKVASMRGAGG